MRQLIFYLLLSFPLLSAANDESPIVAVAANFLPTLNEIVQVYKATTNQNVRLASGASGSLFRQIELGAPYDLFLSADEGYVEKLRQKGLTPDLGQVYAIGKLVLFIPERSRTNTSQELNKIIKQLVMNESLLIAIANPKLAPYGQAAKQVLGRFTQLHMLQKRLILGESVGQTAQFALTNSIDAAFLPHSLTIKNKIQSAGRSYLIPVDLYKPIKQRMVLLNHTSKPAQKFYDFLRSKKGRNIIAKHGYILPED